LHNFQKSAQESSKKIFSGIIPFDNEQQLSKQRLFKELTYAERVGQNQKLL
jgi:hypothetical protein